MKKFILSFALLALVVLGYAQHQVSVENAMNASRNFLAERIGALDTKGLSMTLAYTEYAEDGTPLFYRFQVGDKGFMIVSATDLATPVLAYSLESNFEKGTGADLYCDKYKKQLTYLVEHPETATTDAQLWNKYGAADFQVSAQKGGKGTPCVEPLVTTRWTQETYYNTYCPVSSVPQSSMDYRTPVGCVALTMANILYYYRYPSSGFGGVAYIPREYENGELFYTYPAQVVNFSAQTYNYDAMTDILTDYNGELSKLIYNAGVSVHMSYGHDGSGSQSEYAINALHTNFRFPEGAQFHNYTDVTDQGGNQTTWENMAKAELDARRPIFFSGSNASAGGHAWIMDGYTTIADTAGVDHSYFHVNWGWAGSSNGFYSIKNLNTASYGNFNHENSESMITLLAPNDEDIQKPTSGDVRITASKGTISDGAGTQKDQPNTSRSWVIATPGATKYSLEFSKLKTKAGDKVTIYNGGTPNSPVLQNYEGDYLMAACSDYTNIAGCMNGDFQGQALPGAVTVNADSVLVVFTSNGDDQTDYGFVLKFEATTITTDACAQVTAPITTDEWHGVFTDKPNNQQGNDNPYRPARTCSWQLRVPQAAGYAFNFMKFDLKAGDFVELQNSASNAEQPVLARFDITNPPTGPVYVDAPRVTIKFVSDNWLEGAGFELEFWKLAGIDNHDNIANVTLYPNPATNYVNVNIEGDQAQVFNAAVVDMTGKTVYSEQISFGGGNETHQIGVRNLAKGFYFLHLQNENGKVIRKFIVE